MAAFLGLLLSPFRTVLAPSPRRLDTKFRIPLKSHQPQLLSAASYLFRPKALKPRQLEVERTESEEEEVEMRKTWREKKKVLWNTVI